jgi:uncharacterized protein (DUF433 family)
MFISDDENTPATEFTPWPVVYHARMLTSDLVTIDPQILGGTLVFEGTRVPVKALFDYLKNDHTFVDFLECCPSLQGNSAGRVGDRGW